jgi:hypothetical protein
MEISFRFFLFKIQVSRQDSYMGAYLDSSVNIVIRLLAEYSRNPDKIPCRSRESSLKYSLNVGSTKPLTQWVKGTVFPRVKRSFLELPFTPIWVKVLSCVLNTRNMYTHICMQKVHTYIHIYITYIRKRSLHDIPVQSQRGGGYIAPKSLQPLH